MTSGAPARTNGTMFADQCSVSVSAMFAIVRRLCALTRGGSAAVRIELPMRRGGL